MKHGVVPEVLRQLKVIGEEKQQTYFRGII